MKQFLSKQSQTSQQSTSWSGISNNDREKLVDLLFETWKACTICSSNDTDLDCHWSCIETILITNTLIKMIMKDTPNWINFLQTAIPIIEGCADSCADNNHWHCMNCAASCYNTVDIFNKFLQTGSVPSMLGKGTLASKGKSAYKTFKKGYSGTSSTGTSSSGSSSSDTDTYSSSTEPSSISQQYPKKGKLRSIFKKILL